MEKILDWQKYLDTAAQTVAEGIVMLENHNHALPLDPEKEIALFGRMQLHYYKSGTGSGGMVNVSRIVTVLDGLQEAGIRINPELLQIYREWDEKNPFDLGSGWGDEPWSQEEMPLEESLVRKIAQSCETAVIIIGRTAGEEQDNTLKKGSYLLTDEEEHMLSLVRKHFKKLVVLLNTGNLIDMQFMDLYKPDSVLYIWQGGMTGGTGTADVLTGKVSPSGKLPDTIAYRITDYPSDRNFGNPDRYIYQEDIYIGYRHFEREKFQNQVRYPFGYGRSYTDFALEIKEIKHNSLNNLELNAIVKITNIGNYAGKEVIQVYCQPPQGTAFGNPPRILTAYRKTNLLHPGESQNLKFELIPVTVYDDSGMTGHLYCEIIQKGTHQFYIGTDVRSAKFAAEIQIPETIVISQKRQALAPVESFTRMTESGDDSQPVPVLNFDEEARILESLPEDFENLKNFENHEKFQLADVKSGKISMQEFIAQFSDPELAQLVRGEGMGSPRVTPGTASAFGGVSDALQAYGIPAACCADGPSGMRMDCGTKAFSLPNGTLIASTFNLDLITELFTCLGLEMTANHVDCLLGPGMNLHRHPLNGRNFEYFSEDPYLTGTMAAAELKGLQRSGVTGTLKHFCANNQETNRHELNSVVSERALRELYLKGFEIAVKTGNATAVMTTYGAVNGLWTACSYDLCTEILRNEWGFRGIVMTDWWADLNRRGTAPNTDDFASMVRAQNDLYMVCADCVHHEDNILESLRNGSLTRAELQRNAANICEFLMHTHAMERLIHSQDSKNPVKIINCPAEKSPDDSPIIFYETQENSEFAFQLDLSEIKTEKNTNYAFGLNVRKTGWYEITITASSTQSALAQIPVTLFIMGTASGTFTWNGTDGKPVTFSKKVPLFSKFNAIRLYFAQSGLHMDQITFRYLGEDVSPTGLIRN
ncbi:MAG: glycoside hydrolase family 3 C-terminal domain-containing protein [Oscillospiraceae bacterium]|nr:glycoside hydrolase family 3 C-terminal domain-containing protein [Oscillospiraceae bacterium]